LSGGAGKLACTVLRGLGADNSPRLPDLLGEPMKDLFPQYTNFLNVDYGVVWKHALFVFDTNVLLNLYRYQSKTRDELLNVVEQRRSRLTMDRGLFILKNFCAWYYDERETWTTRTQCVRFGFETKI
jgi:hypothetical protein